jgi:NADPH-dependent curcumin reductase CurA
VSRSKEIHLAARPTGVPTQEHFRLVETELPACGDGEVRVRNTVMSVDPYMRGRMNDAKSYIPPFELDKPMLGGVVGEVVESRSPRLEVGDTVLHMLGWREEAVLDAKYARKLDLSVAPATAYLGLLGTIGFTAWVGLFDIAGMQEGDTVFVSGAAGAVGSVAGQLAKLRGAARVIGSAGSDAKVAYLLDELGFDSAFNYRRDEPVRRQLRAAAPDGIDVYFDNVGGEHLEAAIASLKPFGRAALCGAISQYNDTDPTGPRNMSLCVGKRLTLRGFIVSDHDKRFPAMAAEVSAWLRDGSLRLDETYVEGIENAPEALIGLLRGDNTGKMLVKIT